MESIYVIQDKNYKALAATFSEEKAISFCKTESKSKFSYRTIPYINSDEHTITSIAGPIPAKYLK
jgi:hypothetical protein